MNYLPSIGLEVHVQLKTRSKMFCSCGTAYGAPPNTQVCPVCLGYPGAMPVMNEEAIHLTVLSGLMLGCKIASYSKFDRKSYFYPDMPKNYQITQYDKPLCLGGAVDAEAGGKPVHVGITRIHLEEDVGKSTHHPTCSGVDFNRAGVPLMEIVTEPDMTSADEAMAFLLALKQLLLYVGVSACNLEEGNMRCDVNISVRPEGTTLLGTKVEIKNMNTFKGVHAALQYEIGRQIAARRESKTIVQETRRWDPDMGVTEPMRSKEDAHDYRYFPEPDLLPVVLSDEKIAEWRASLPERPADRRARLIAEYGIPAYDAGVLTADRAVADFFEEAAKSCGQGKLVSNWVMTDVMRLLGETGKTLAQCALTPAVLAELVQLVEQRVINQPTAKGLLPELFAQGGSPKERVASRGLGQVGGAEEIASWAEQAIASNPKIVQDFLAGKQVAAQALVGQVMKLSRGKADPQLAGKLVFERLAARKAEHG